MPKPEKVKQELTSMLLEHIEKTKEQARKDLDNVTISLRELAKKKQNQLSFQDKKALYAPLNQTAQNTRNLTNLFNEQFIDAFTNKLLDELIFPPGTKIKEVIKGIKVDPEKLRTRLFEDYKAMIIRKLRENPQKEESTVKHLIVSEPDTSPERKISEALDAFLLERAPLGTLHTTFIILKHKADGTKIPKLLTEEFGETYRIFNHQLKPKLTQHSDIVATGVFRELWTSTPLLLSSEALITQALAEGTTAPQHNALQYNEIFYAAGFLGLPYFKESQKTYQLQLQELQREAQEFIQSRPSKSRSSASDESEKEGSPSKSNSPSPELEQKRPEKKSSWGDKVKPLFIRSATPPRTEGWAKGSSSSD